MRRLIDNETGREIKIGDRVTTHNGDNAELIGYSVPTRPESSGRVMLKFDDVPTPREFFPSVIGCSFEDPVSFQTEVEKSQAKVERAYHKALNVQNEEDFDSAFMEYHDVVTAELERLSDL